MRRIYFGCINALCVKGVRDPVCYIARIGNVADMLQLAPATGREMPARRCYMVRARLNASVCTQPIPWRRQRRMAAIRCHPLPTRRNADNQVGIVHNVAGRR